MKTQKPAKKQPAKRGRKPISIDYEKIEKLAAQGLLRSEIGRALGYGNSSFYKAKAADDEIEQAILRGRAKAHVFSSTELIKQIRNGSTSAVIWFEKTRLGMKEIITSEITGKDGTPLNVDPSLSPAELTDEQLLTIIGKPE